MNLVEKIGTRNIEIPIFIFRVLNHDVLKPKLLAQISDLGSYSIINEGQRISNTDWHLKPNEEYLYRNTFLPIAINHLSLLSKELSHKNQHKVIIEKCWFQQYNEGDYHDLHLHNGSLSSVYYLELNDDSPRTTFFINGEEVTIPVSEGQIISLPSYIEHESKPNGKNRKTVIAYNSWYG